MSRTLADGRRHLQAEIFAAQLSSSGDPAILVGQTIIGVERYLQLLRAQDIRMRRRGARAGRLRRLRFAIGPGNRV